MKKYTGKMLLILVALSFGVISSKSRSNTHLPNIIFILADDLGIGDLKAYNIDSKIHTPNLNKLAAEGMRFTNAYCPDAVCLPTRYAFITKRYSWRSDLQNGVVKNWEPPLIEQKRITIAEFLKKAGYSTAIFGKWHLGSIFHTEDGKAPVGQGEFFNKNSGANIDFSKPIFQGPITQGFDKWYGINSASEAIVYEQDKAVKWFQATAVPTHPSVKQLEETSIRNLMGDFTEESVNYVKAQSKRKDKPFFLYLATYIPHAPIMVEERFLGKTKAGEYGDYIYELDHYIGVLLKTLDDAGLRENTMIVFASDNGSAVEITGEGHEPNAPYSGKKGSVLEGGVKTPLILRWPAKVKPGSTNDQLIGLIDFYATFAGIINQPIPNGNAEDSKDFSSGLIGNATNNIRDALVVKSLGKLKAIRSGKWKYINGAGDGGYGTNDEADGRGQLYDLVADPGETVNLIDRYPEVAKKLKLELGKTEKIL